jgi:ribosomal protein S18 acetylase RimI-like enzyme
LNGKAVAFANAVIRTSPGSPPPRFAYIDNVHVLSESRGLGVGTAIARYLEAWAEALGIRELRLDVFANNEAAVAFWRAAGFGERAYSMSKRIAASVND